MSNNTVELILSAKDEKLINVLKHSETQIKTFGDKTTATFRRCNESMKMWGNSLTTTLGALGISYGIVEMGRDMMEFDGKLRTIRRTANLSVKDIDDLRKSIYGLIDPNAKIKIPLTKGEFADMAIELNATGIQLNVIKDLLPQVGKGAVAAGADNKIYAGTIGELLDKYKVLLKDLPAIQEQLNTSMKFEDVRKSPNEYLQSISRLAKIMQLTGATGKENVTPLMAMIAQLTKITGSAGDAQTSVDALMNGMLRLSKNRQMVAALKTHGIEFFDKDGSMKNLNELLPELKKLGDVANKHGMDIDAVAMNIFGRPEAGKAIMAVVKYYDEIKKKQEELKASSGELDKDFAIEAEAMTSKLKEFQNQLDRFKVDHMSNALKFLSSVLDQLNKHPLIAKGGLAVIVGGISIIAISKMIGAIGDMINFSRDIGGIWSGKKGGKTTGGFAGPLGNFKGPVPVYVVNRPTGGIGGTPNVPGGDELKTGWLKKLLVPSAVIATTIGTAIVAHHYLQKGGSPVNLGMALHGMPEADFDIDAYTRFKKEKETIKDKIDNFYHSNEKVVDKNNYTFNFKIDKDGRVFGDKSYSDGDFIINVLRGDYGV